MVRHWRSALERERRSLRARRADDTDDSGHPGTRSPYERDRDRILYSSEFRRLAGITQVAAVHEMHLLHNRLTHSLKVAQVGRRISERLLRDKPALGRTGVDLIPEVVEVAGLAHDLGHPPFGHVAERVLHSLLKDICGGFEGNAQTFRILTKLAVRKQDEAASKVLLGLNLTRASLNAVLKYPRFWPPDRVKPEPWTNRSEGEKWGAYRSELREFKFARKLNLAEVPKVDKEIRKRSANSVIMDWADDVAFATHDLQDYVQAGLVDFSRLRKPQILERFRAYSWKAVAKRNGMENDFNQAFNYVVEPLVESAEPYDGSREQKARLHAQITQWIIELDGACQADGNSSRVVVTSMAQYQAEILKCLTNYFVVNHPGLRVAEQGQERLIREVFDRLVHILDDGIESSGAPIELLEHYELCAEEEEMGLVPRKVSNHVYSVHRAASDYICTLTESQLFDLYGRMSGTSRSSIFGTWFK